jgi:hypothetical protein
MGIEPRQDIQYLKGFYPLFAAPLPIQDSG